MIELFISLLSSKVSITILIFAIPITAIVVKIIDIVSMAGKENLVERVKSELSKEAYIYETKKDALVSLLSEITDVIDSIDSNYNHEAGGYYPIRREDLSKFSKALNRNSLFINKDIWLAFSLIYILLVDNSIDDSPNQSDTQPTFGYYDYYLIHQ
ncbi:MAG: hypothetical protein ACYDEX_23230, partial [Mobilitalea sp.]